MMFTVGKPRAIYRRKVDSNVEEIAFLCVEVRALLAPSDPVETRFAVELLAHESLCNAMVHGNHKNADKKVSLEILVGCTWIRLQVTDEGNGFDWRKEILSSRDEGATSGRGIALYALYADRMQFNALGNQVTLWISKKAST